MGSSGGGNSPSAVPKWLWDHHSGSHADRDYVLGLFFRTLDAGDDGGEENNAPFLNALTAARVDSPYRVDGSGVPIQELVPLATERPAYLLGSSAGLGTSQHWDQMLRDWVEGSLGAGITRVSSVKTDRDDIISALVDEITDNELLQDLTGEASKNSDNLRLGINSLISKAVIDMVDATESPLRTALTHFGGGSSELPALFQVVSGAAGSIAGSALSTGNTAVGSIPASETAAADAKGRTAADSVKAEAIEGRLSTQTIGNSHEANARTNLLAIATTLTSKLITEVGRAIDAAQAKALELVNTSAIDDAVDAFEDSAKPAYMRSVNRMSGQFVDINAVHTSTFILMGGQMENEYRADIERFRANLVLESYNRVLDLYMRSFMQSYTSSLQAYINELNAYVSIGNNLTDSSTRAFITAYTTYVQTYLTTLGEYTNIFNTEVGAGTQLTGNVINQQMQTFLAGMESYVGSYVKEILERRRLKMAYLDGSARVLEESKSKLGRFRLETYNFLSQLNRDKISALRERALDRLSVQEKGRMWDFDVYQRAANILGASGGSVGYTTLRQSPLMSTLSGAASGAALGAEFGPIGLLTGAAIGGIIGEGEGG